MEPLNMNMSANAFIWQLSVSMLKCSAFPLLLKRKEIAVIGYCKKTFEEEAREIDAAGSLIVMELNISYFQPSNQKVTNVEDS